MKISIITVSYNSENTIEDAIDSVLGQTRCDLEYIIIDGGSTDRTLEIIKRKGKFIDKFISETDDGLYDGMNKGISFVTGDVIGFLNSDDVYENEDVLYKVCTEFKKTGKDSVYGDLVYVDQGNLNKIVRRWRSGHFEKAKFQYGWMPPHPTFFVRKKIFKKHGCFNTTLHQAADYEIMLRFLYKHNISVSYIPETLVRMRIGGISNSSLNNRIKANKEDRLSWEINGLRPRIFTLWLKPLRKIVQFLFRSKVTSKGF